MNKINWILPIIYIFLPLQTTFATEQWVGAWVSGQQLAETANVPPSPGLTNNTLLRIAHVSIGGSQPRVQFSNEYGTSPVTINSVHPAQSAGSSSIAPATDSALTYNH